MRHISPGNSHKSERSGLISYNAVTLAEEFTAQGGIGWSGS
jgi:hypothetical protein